MILKLIAATLLGGLIGLEREVHGRPAGLRTHILVCLGSTLFALTSFNIAGKLYDPGRITAQIVTGIGFLGAGTIMRQGSVVRGLTTAASIWTIAAIGIAVAIGGDMYFIAIATALLVVFTLYLVPHVESYSLRQRNERLLTLVVQETSQSISCVLEILARHGAQIRLLGSEEGECSGSRILKTRIMVGHDFNEAALGADLVASECVISYSWE